MDSAIEVRYAGVVVGRALPLRDRDAAGTFVVFAEPLPVGTKVVLKIDDAEQTARVTEVVESADPNLGGMRLRFMSASDGDGATLEMPSRAMEDARPPEVASAPAASETGGETAPSAAILPSSDGDVEAAGGSGKRRRRRR